MSNNDDVFNKYGFKMSRLEGLILTQLEASLPDGSQLIALKSVMRSLLWDWFYRDLGKVDDKVAIEKEIQELNNK